MNTELLEQTHEELILGFLAEGGDDFTSGEALSSKLGLTNKSVWKHVESLRLKGYRIEAIAARGYRLVEIPDRLTTLELSPLLETHDLGHIIHFHESVTSTNEVASKLAAEGAEHGEIVVADAQTAGKGRRGRTWTSPAGANLYFTAILRPDGLPPVRAPELTLVAAVALAETLIEAGADDAAIKWPNDVEVEGKKIAGILTELSADSEEIHHVLLGIGVNLNESPTEGELLDTAISLAEARGQRVPRALFTAALWTRLEEWLDLHSEEGFDAVRARWRELSSTVGQEVLVKTDTSELRGVAEDIDADGALLVRTEDGTLHRVLAGDVHQLRPRRQPRRKPLPE